MDHLYALLDANQAFALNGRGTTNHCPMALHALHEMGASPRQLQRFFTHWQTTQALPSGVDNQGEEEEALFVALRQQLLTRFAEEGWLPCFEELLAQRFSPAGGAFHPLIRFACALENGHLGEQAAALAAWQCKALILPAGTGAPSRDVTRLLAGLLAHWEGHAGKETGSPPACGRWRPIPAGRSRCRKASMTGKMCWHSWPKPPCPSTGRPATSPSCIW